jgi:hypothetical protein
MFKIDHPALQNFAYLGFHCDSSVTRGVVMPECTKLVSLSDERRKQAIQRELAAFEKLENDFNTRERKERVARLGLVLGNFTFSTKETSNEQQG